MSLVISSSGGMPDAEIMAIAKAEGANPTSVHHLRELLAEPWGTHPDVQAAVLVVTYRQATPFPLLEATRDEWIEWFRRFGYTWGPLRAERKRPREPITLYRACRPEYRDGLSWTTSLATATRYHWRDPRNRFYTATAEPACLLGRYPPTFHPAQDEHMAAVPMEAITEVQPLAMGTGPLRVHFVCAGNICRSPLAALLLQQMADAAGVAVEASSSGWAPTPGEPMDPDTLACAAEHGIDGTTHTASAYERYGALERHHVVVALDGFVGNRIAAVAATFSRTGAVIWRRAVDNPWRKPRSAHERAYRDIEAICREIVDIAARRAPNPTSAKTMRAHATPTEHGKITADDLERARRALAARNHPATLARIGQDAT